MADVKDPVIALSQGFNKFLRMVGNKLARVIPGYQNEFVTDSLAKATDDVFLTEMQFQSFLSVLTSGDSVFGGMETTRTGLRAIVPNQVFSHGLAVDYVVDVVFSDNGVSFVVTPRNLKYARDGVILVAGTVEEFLKAVSTRSGIGVADLLAA